jgi:hypothetical protein
MRSSYFICAGMFLLSVGCSQVVADVDVGGANGDALTEAFFGVGVRENLPVLVSEDQNADGNLDVDEDINLNGILDPGEDIDGDGELDFFDEDTNGNGVIDVVEADVNGDGVITEADNATVSIFTLVASGGGVSCEDFAGALLNDETPIINDTVLLMFGIQASLGPDIENEFSSGNTVTAREAATDLVILQTIFGEFENGQDVDGRSAADSENNTLTIDRLGNKLSASLTATLLADDNSETPLEAKFNRIENCQALSDGLQEQLDAGSFSF